MGAPRCPSMAQYVSLSTYRVPELLPKSVDSVENAGPAGVEPVDKGVRVLESFVNALLSFARVSTQFLCLSTLTRTFHPSISTAHLLTSGKLLVAWVSWGVGGAHAPPGARVSTALLSDPTRFPPFSATCIPPIDRHTLHKQQDSVSESSQQRELSPQCGKTCGQDRKAHVKQCEPAFV